MRVKLYENNSYISKVTGKTNSVLQAEKDKKNLSNTFELRKTKMKSTFWDTFQAALERLLPRRKTLYLLVRVLGRSNFKSQVT